MSNAERLIIDQFVYSKTDGNTVEHSCVDESLTGKCIDYHNDQWFTFEIGDSPNVYINLSGQDCRDMRGVQLVVLSGELCQPETYKVYDCISTATQDDIYIALELDPNKKYWLNVDGYLHDYCKFFIDVSYTPKGISFKAFSLTESNITSTENIIQLQWQVPDSLKYRVVESYIYRKKVKDFRYQLIDSVGLNLNAFGEIQNHYNFSDTLLYPGDYQYQLAFKLQNGEKRLFARHKANIPGRYATSGSKLIILEFDFDQRSPLVIEFKDAETGQLLRTEGFIFNPSGKNRMTFYSNVFYNRSLEIIVTHKNSGYQRTYYYLLGE